MPLDPKNAETMARYYERTNVGDFLGALEFLAEDVVYRIPGPSAIVPYSGEWRGKDQVILCFQAFNAAFGLVDMAETRAVSGPDEVFSLNDEIFVARSTGRPWRVGVVHHMVFDAEHRIARLDNYTDMVAAVQALGGQSAIEVPMLPPDLVAGETEVADERAVETVLAFYRGLPEVDELLDDDASALMPGDRRRLRFAGNWRGRTEFNRMATYLGEAFALDADPVSHVVAERGSVAVVLNLRGTFRPTNTPVDLAAVDFLQITGAGRIGRLCRYVDTHEFTRV